MELAHLQDLQDNLAEVETEIRNDFSQFEGSIQWLDSIPGIDSRPLMPFWLKLAPSWIPSYRSDLCSWAGLAPVVTKAPGRRKNNRSLTETTISKPLYVKWPGDCFAQTVVSVGWYWRLKQRTDAKRAIVALAHKLLVIIYAMLKSKSAYDEQNSCNARRHPNRNEYREWYVN
jgi:hypothetical protein